MSDTPTTPASLDTETALTVRAGAPTDGGGLFPGLNLREAYVFCKSASGSGLIPVERPEQAMMIILAGREHGLSPMASLMNCHLIKGKFTMSADMVAALATRRGVQMELVESTSQKATYRFNGAGRTTPFDFTFSMEDAKLAGLLGKPDSNWSKYPAAMLRARALTQGLRAVYPGLLSGAYLADELQTIDVTPEPAPKTGPAALGLPATPHPEPGPVPVVTLAADVAKARTDGARKTTASDCAHMETSLSLDERAEARSQAQVPEEYASRPVNGAWDLASLERYLVALRAMVASKANGQALPREPGDEQDGLPL